MGGIVMASVDVEADDSVVYINGFCVIDVVASLIDVGMFDCVMDSDGF